MDWQGKDQSWTFVVGVLYTLTYFEATWRRTSTSAGLGVSEPLTQGKAGGGGGGGGGGRRRGWATPNAHYMLTFVCRKQG